MEMLSAFCRGLLIATVRTSSESEPQPSARNGLRLSQESASELLRRERAQLQQLPNIVPAPVPKGARLVVVGDLHGQVSTSTHRSGDRVVVT